MSSRKEQKAALRAERERRAQEAAAAERRRQLVGYATAGALGLAVVAAIVVVVVAGGGGGSGGGGSAGPAKDSDFVKAGIPPQRATTLDQAAAAARCTVKQWPSEGQNHTSAPYKYKTNPPTSGNHFEIPAADGAYVRAPNIGELVHELEHGRVILWYRPDVSARLKGQLKTLFDEDDYHLVLSPNPTKMPYEVAASAWTRSITCEKANDKTFDALRLFRDRYRDQAPETVQ